MSTLQLPDAGVLRDSIRDCGYSVCDSPWYVALYLDRVFFRPTAAEFTDALTNVHVTFEDRTMLWLHLAAADRTLSMRDLACALKAKDAALVHLRYSMLAARIAEFVSFPLEYFDDSLHCLSVRVDFGGRDGNERWEMRPELANALMELGWVSICAGKYELCEVRAQ